MSSESSPDPMLQVIKEWEEESKKPTFSPCFKLVDSPDKGWHMIATRELLMGDTIIVEEPLFQLPHNKMHPDILSNPEYQKAQATVDRLTGSNLTQEQLLFQTEAPVVLKEEIRASFWLSQQVKPEKHAEIWNLADSRHQAHIGEKVMVYGLQSKAGRQLNGTFGRVVQNDDKDPTRVGVEIRNGNGDNTLVKSIKRSNTKTLLGIMFTNGFAIPDGVALYKTTSRINHACGMAANSLQGIVEGKVYVIVFVESIKAGDEILFDYLKGHESSGATTDRMEELQKKYGFTCDCSFHGS